MITLPILRHVTEQILRNPTELFGIGPTSYSFNLLTSLWSEHSSDPKTITDYQGLIRETLPGEMKRDGGRRIDHADGQMYNAGVVGIEYVDTDEFGQKLDNISIPFGPAATNYLHNSYAPATQTRTLDAGVYCVHMRGTGSITLSGGVVGSVTENNYVNFTLEAAAAVMFTVAGVVDVFQCNNGPVPTRYIYTSGGSANTDADDIRHILNASNFNDEEGAFVLELRMGYGSADKPTGSGYSGGVSVNNDLASLMYDHNTEGQISAYPGVVGSHSNQSHNRNDKILFMLNWGNGFFQLARKNLTQNLPRHNGAERPYDGSWSPLDEFRFFIGADLPADILGGGSYLKKPTHDKMEADFS